MIAALARLFWLRDRYLWLGLAAVYALALVALPPSWIEMTSGPDVGQLVLVAVPIAFAILAGCDVERVVLDDTSYFPRLLKTLPLSNVALAAPLLVYATAACAVLWGLGFLVAWTAGNSGFAAARADDMLLQLALVPWVLAAVWAPLERVWLRRMRGAAGIFAFWITYKAWLDWSALTAGTLVAICAVLGAGWIVATEAAARERSRRPERARGAAVRVPRAAQAGAFHSAASALQWYGRRLNRNTFQLTVFFVALVCLPGIIGAARGVLSVDEAESMLVYAWLPACASVLLAAAPLSASHVAYDLSSPQRAGALHQMLAVLPCTAGELAAARLAVVARQTSQLTVLIALAAGAVAAASGLADVCFARLAALAAEHGTLAAIAVAAAAIVSVPAAAAACAANVAWLGMSGSRLNLLPSLILIFAVFPYFLVAHDRRDFPVEAVEILVRLAPILAAAKLAILAALISRVARGGLYAPRTVKRIVGCWIGAACVLALANPYLGPESATFVTAVAVSILLTPVLGFFAAPLALQANRCR